MVLGLASAAVHAAEGPDRLTPDRLGLVVNTADPDSVRIGEAYARVRHLRPDQMLRVSLPLRPVLTPQEFEGLRAAVETHFPRRVVALALAWTRPWAVECQSINGALALGWQPGWCAQTCAPSKVSPYFTAPTLHALQDSGARLSMHLAGENVAEVVKLIERGAASDGSQLRPQGSGATAWFVSTTDKARNVRASMFPASRSLWHPPLDVRIAVTDTLRDVDRVILYQTGLAHVDGLESVRFAPGALADHLTSAGGVLQGGTQMSALRWLEAGATASYGTVSEPCNHPQKFPHPQRLLDTYVHGSTAIEAYWSSVAWPLQGVFVGEPLAAPYAAMAEP